MEVQKNTLLFIDSLCPNPYHPGQLQGCGGTEATVVDIAEGLSQFVNVVVEQHNRKEEYVGKASYTSPGRTTAAKWVVILRDPTASIETRKRFPNAKIYLWSHDVATHDLGSSFQSGHFQGITANICVSNWHKTQTIELLYPLGYRGEFKHKVIYNPLNEDVEVYKGPYDRNKLMWMSSPHKGLDRAYQLLKILLKHNPEFKLYVANPGYLRDYSCQDLEENTVMLGSLSHMETLKQLSNSLCLFYPNTVFPETFGKVISESNGCGVPVLMHNIGAAREVLDPHPDQLVNCNDDEAVIKRVLKWWSGERPTVRGKPTFKLQTILNQWMRLLNDAL